MLSPALPNFPLESEGKELWVKRMVKQSVVANIIRGVRDWGARNMVKQHYQQCLASVCQHLSCFNNTRHNSVQKDKHALLVPAKKISWHQF